MKYKLLRFSLLSILVMLCGGGNLWADDVTQYTFEKVTTSSDLTVGDKYIIVCEADNVAMGAATSNKKSRDKVDVTIDNKKILSTSADIAQFTLGGETDAWTLSDATDSYLALTKSSNEIHVATTGDANTAKWKINVTESTTSIENLGTSGRYIKYNSQSSIFRCYASGQKDVVLYKLTKGEQQTVGTAITLSFPQAAYTATIGETFTSPALTIDPNTYDGTVTYDSSDKTVATVADDGTVTIVAAGKTTITATAPATTNYQAGEASYTLTVSKAVEDGKFDFTINQDYGSGVEQSSVKEQTSTWTAGNVIMKLAGRNCWYTSNDLRIYKTESNKDNAGSMTFSVPTGKVITKIEITGTKLQHLSDASSTTAYTVTNSNKTGTWEGSANSVVLSNTGTDNATITLIEVTYGDEQTTPATGFRDIKADLTGTALLPDGTAPAQYTDVSTGVAVAEDGTLSRIDTDAANAAAVFKGRWHGTKYGWNNFSATVPVEGCVKITLGASDYGSGAVVVTNSDGDEVAKIDNHTGAMWSTSNSDNVAVGYYRTNKATTLTFSQCDYIPYFAVEAIDEADLPEEVMTYTVTYAAGDGTGVAPAAVEVNAGEKTAAPKNTTLYKEGYTLTGWTDGTVTYAPGDEIAPTENLTLTAVFTENTVSLADRTDAVTVTWALGEKNGVAGVEYNGNTGIIVTQATVNSNTIDVKLDVDATGAKFSNKGRGDAWAMINANTKLTIPACKDAVVTATAYATDYNLAIGSDKMTDNGDKTYTYTVADDVTSIDIIPGAQVYLSHVAVTLPKVESEEPSEPTGDGTIFEWAYDGSTTAMNSALTGTNGTVTLKTTDESKSFSTESATYTSQIEGLTMPSKGLKIGANATYLEISLTSGTFKAGDQITVCGYNEIAFCSEADKTKVAVNAKTGSSKTDYQAVTVTLPDTFVESDKLYVYRNQASGTGIAAIQVVRKTADPNAVATPEITPATGTYTSEREVTITCATEGATIYYTTDGNDPTSESTEYTAAFTVTETTTVKAIAINGENKSDIAEAVITITNLQPGESNLEWDYTEKSIPTTSPDNGLYYSGYVNDATGTNNGLHGVKLYSGGYAYFAKNPVAGKLTLTIGNRKTTSAYAVNVYSCTIENGVATKGSLIGEVSVSESPGTGSIDLKADVTGVYIERKTSAEGVLSKIVFKETVARNFTDFEIPYTTLQADGYTGSNLPTGVTFSGTFHDKQHGYNNVTLVVPVDGTVKFTISGCQYGNTFNVKNSDGKTLTTLDQKSVGCYDAGGTLTYFYVGEATTLTFENIGYLAYFKAQATEVSEVTITYKDQNGNTLGTKTVYEGEALGEVPYTENDLTIDDGYKFRGWVYTNGEKVKATDIVDGSKSVIASVTAIETEPTTGSIQTYSLTQKTFYPEDHENFDVTNGIWHDVQHGFVFSAGGSFSVKVAEKAQVVLALCQFSADGGTITVTDADGKTVKDDVAAKVSTDGATATIDYDGGKATTLTFTFSAQAYVHSVTVYNVEDFIEKDAESNYYEVPAGDGASFVLALNAAANEDGSKIFLPNGTYDLGEAVLTAINGKNLSIIGESMDGVVIKNAPPVAIEGLKTTATLHNLSENLYLQDLTIQNALDYYSAGSAGRGIAFWDEGKNTVAKNVKLLSYQDTYLSTVNQKFYFEDSEIHGAVDYICGGSDVFFENCLLVNESRKADSKSGEATITAHQPGTQETHGYVFNNCTIENKAATFNYGRAWGGNSGNGPKQAYLNTTLNQPSEIIATRFITEGMNEVAKSFKEYNTVDAEGNVVSPASNILSFTYKKDTLTYETILTDAEADEYTVDKVLGTWAATAQEESKQLETTNVKLEGTTLTWDAVTGATLYAICKNGSIIDFTDQTTYTISSTSPAKGLGTTTDGSTTDTYSVRVANAKGGFGEAVEATVATGIEVIGTTTATAVISEVYSLDGAKLSAPQRGVNIIKMRMSDGSQKTVKVIVK